MNRTQQRAPQRRGFTIIELLIVIGIIMFLMMVLGATLSKIRERTRIGRSRTLVQKLYNGLEIYHLQFRAYPPLTTPSGLTGSQALYWFLTTPFRMTPVAAKGEVWADMNLGPCISNFEENEYRANGAGFDIIDAWNNPIQFKLNVLADTNGITESQPLVYSCGSNGQDEHIVFRAGAFPGSGIWATTAASPDPDANSDDLTSRSN
jgi:type II secretory pathway pseudopilin PulG